MTVTKERARFAHQQRYRAGAAGCVEVVQRTLDYIAQALAKGDKVELRNFGVFEVKTRKAKMAAIRMYRLRMCRYPQRNVVKFKPGKEMRTEVLKLPPMQNGEQDSETESETDI